MLSSALSNRPGYFEAFLNFKVAKRWVSDATE